MCFQQLCRQLKSGFLELFDSINHLWGPAPKQTKHIKNKRKKIKKTPKTHYKQSLECRMGWNLCSERSQLFPAHQAQKCFREVEIKTFCTLVIPHPVAPKILTKLPRICCPPWENVQNSGLSPECGASPCTQPPPDFFFPLVLGLESCLERFHSENSIFLSSCRGVFTSIFALVPGIILQTPSNILTKFFIYSESVSSLFLIPN